MFAFLGQAWNVLGGYGGQFSFGHALFFGGGAFGTGDSAGAARLNAYVAGAIAIALTALVGGLLGYLVFPLSAARGAYFALVTLAFAEVARVLVASFEYTGGGFGMLVPLAPGAANFQFADRRIFYLIVWALVALGCLIALWLENSRFGARLMAVRENEDGAQALGHRSRADEGARRCTLSAAMAATAGVFYVQTFLFVDSQLRFGPANVGRGAAGRHHRRHGHDLSARCSARSCCMPSAKLAKQITGNAPGLNLVLYGILLILALALHAERPCGSDQSARSRKPGGRPPMLEVRNLSKRFGGLAAVDGASLDVAEGEIVALIGPNGAGKTTLFAAISGFVRPDSGTVRFAGADITALAPHLICARGLARTFQIVQPFETLSVRENIAVGAHLHRPGRAAMRLPMPKPVARRVGLGRPAGSAGGKPDDRGAQASRTGQGACDRSETDPARRSDGGAESRPKSLRSFRSFERFATAA